MSKMAAIGFVMTLAASVACGVREDGPPVIEVDRSACAHCGMLISEPRFAAAYRTAPGTRHEAPGTTRDTQLFDDIGCLLNALPREADRSNIRFWFHDMTTAEWIDGSRAVFVQSARLRTPMAGGVVAYSDRAAAERGAAEHEGRVIGALDELLTQPRKGGES